MPEPAIHTVRDLLTLMVGHNTINRALPGSVGGEGALIDRVALLAEAWGLPARRLPVEGQCDQLLLTHEADPDAPWLLLDSHLDTVAVEGMTIDPFGATIEGDKLFGRGACDTKGTAAAMLWAMRDYAASDAQPNNIALLLSVDEEAGMTGIQSFVANDLPALGWTPWGAIVGEPTECHPVVAHNGCVRWSLTTHGVAAHSSVPHEGSSAISAMVKVIDAIESRYAPSLTADHPLTGAPVCSVNIIRGGSAFNIIPDRCTIDIDRRVTPHESMRQVTPALRYMIDALVGVEYDMRTRIEHPPLSAEGSEAVLLPAVKAVLEAMGLATVAVGAPFATHAAYLGSPDHADLPTLVLGPGSPHKAHTRDEWVSLPAIERGVDMYGRLMRYNPGFATDPSR